MNYSPQNPNFSKSLFTMAAWLGLMILLSACGDSQPVQATSPQPANQATQTSQITQTLHSTAQPSVIIKTTAATTQAPATAPQISPTVSPSTSAVARTPEEEDIIREAVLRYRFEQVRASYTSAPVSQYYCIGLGETVEIAKLQDSPPAFLARFQNNKPPVRKASDCTFNKDKVEVKNTGETATIWVIGSIKWLGNNEAELEISYTRAFMDSGGTIFQLKKENGGWKVTGSTRTWIT